MKNFAWAVLGFVTYPVAMPVILTLAPEAVSLWYVNVYMSYLNTVGDICQKLFG